MSLCRRSSAFAAPAREPTGAFRRTRRVRCPTPGAARRSTRRCLVSTGSDDVEEWDEPLGPELPPSTRSSAMSAARRVGTGAAARSGGSRVTDPDDGVDQRVLERAIDGRRRGGEESRHGPRVADAAERLGGGRAGRGPPESSAVTSCGRARPSRQKPSEWSAAVERSRHDRRARFEPSRAPARRRCV